MLQLIRYRPLRDRIILWGFLAVLAFAGLFPVRPRGVYLSDPFSGTVLATIAISAAFSVVSYGAGIYIAKRRKVPKVDRGRMDDIRLQANGYGEHILRGYGKFRAAGFLLDATSIIHTTNETEGRPGGKGAPKPPTPGEVNHVYTTTLDIGVCESLGALSPDLKITRIWENFETIFDTTVTAQGDAFYEAERPGNTLAGGATTTLDASASGGEVVTLPTNGSIQFNGLYGNGTAVVEFYYKTTAANTVELTPSPLAMFPETLHNTDGEWHVYRTAPFSMTTGFVNTLKIKNTHATTMYVDRACVRISGQATGIINPYTVRSAADDNDTIARYGEIPEPDGDGVTTAQIVAGGNANIRIYNGSETQDPDSAFVALHGVGNVPAYRGLAHVVFDSYVLKEPALPNFNFEVDTGCYDVDDIVQDLYGLVSVDSGVVNVTALSGLALGTDEGFLITSREEAGRWLADLMTCFQFDMVEVDGETKAVLRNGSSVATISADELRAHWKEPGSDEKGDDFEVEITDADPLALPYELSVGFMDALLDYHTNTQSATVGSGVFGDKQTVNLSMILTHSHARQLAATILDQRHIESRTFKIKVPPKYQKLHPGDVFTINTSSGASHTARLGEHAWQLMGVQEMSGVRHAASVYSQSIAGSAGSGYEPPVIPYPGTTKLLIMDLPALRPEDLGGGTMPVRYRAACLQGAGTWRGAFEFKERPIGSGSYQLEGPVDLEAGIGAVVSGTAGTIDRTVWDRSTSFVVDFLPVTSLSSATEEDVNANPELNLLAIGNMADGWYVCQFTTVSAGTPADPYQSRYTVSGLLWDRFGSGVPAAGSLAGLDVVVLNSAVKPMLYPLEDIGVARNYKCPTAGQSVDDAPTVTFTADGTSLKPLPPTDLRGERNSVGDLLVTWVRRERFAASLRDRVGTPLNEEQEVYVFEVYSGATLKRSVRNPNVLIQQTIRWQELDDPGGTLTISTDYTLSHTDDGINVARGTGMDSFAGDFVAEFVINADEPISYLGVLPAAHVSPVGIVNPFDQYKNAGYPYFYCSFSGAVGGKRAWPMGNASYAVDIADGDRISIHRTGSVVRFYKNYASQAAPVPILETSFSASEALRLYFETTANTGNQGLDPSRIQYGKKRGYNYTANQQTEDFGSVQSSVKVRVYQESAVVGRGRYTEATL